MNRAMPLLVAAGLLAAPLQAGAQAPPYLPVQGVLYDGDGAPVDSDVVMTFSLYDTEIGGTALWTELQVILVEDGFFTAYLGESTVLDLSMFRDNTDLWLGVMVEGDSEMRRVYLGSTAFSGYAEYCGNIPTHGHDFTDVTGTIDPSTLPSGLVVGAQSCSGTAKMSGVDSSGTITCSADLDTDTDTTYTSGVGLILSGDQFAVDTSVIQRRVTGTCAVDQAIAAVNGDGTVTCRSVYTGDITGVTAGTGLTGGGTTGTVTLNADTAYLQRRVIGTCAAGSSIRAISATGTVTCETDDVGSGGGAITRAYANYATSTLSTSTVYLYAVPAFTPTAAETCHVTADMTINAATANTGMGPFFRIAVQTNGTDGNDNQFGFYPGELATNNRASMSRSTILTLSASTSYRFGCYFGGVSGDWLSDSVYCRITYICW